MTDELENLRATVGPIIDAIRNNVQCDVGKGHQVGLMFGGHDIAVAAMLVVAQSRAEEHKASHVGCAKAWCPALDAAEALVAEVERLGAQS